MNEQGKGCVFLVGAGCGARDLITLRGLDLLRKCDAVVYDALIDPALVDEAGAAERYPVGKRCGRHSVPQGDTNRLLVELAQGGKRVVRLKGGDPFVFGRGGEEILALQAAGIPYEEVPGISSAIAIPAAAGIPVTHREVSRSFHVITGHTNALGDVLPESMETLAALEGTLIFLMGLTGLEKIARRLMEAGKRPDTPAAVVSGGNSPHKAAVRGTLADIAQKTRQAGVQAPAVIVVGAVAGLDMGPTMVHPLDGACIGLVGTPVFTEKLERGFQDLGARTFRVAAARVERLPLDFPAEELCADRDKWVVLTSANGVRCFFQWLEESGVDLRRLGRCKFAVIGKATGGALRKHGIRAGLCPELATGAALAEELCRTVAPGEEVLLFRSASSNDLMARTLAAGEIPVRDFDLYDAVFTQAEAPEPLDYLIFASAGGVKSYFKDHAALPEGVTAVCIGPVSAEELARQTGAPFLTAPEISAGGILQCVREDWSRRSGRETEGEA